MNAPFNLLYLTCCYITPSVPDLTDSLVSKLKLIRSTFPEQWWLFISTLRVNSLLMLMSCFLNAQQEHMGV